MTTRPTALSALRAAVLLVGGFAAAGSWAVELGDVDLTSRLNQPLQGAIALSDLGELTAAEIQVALADQAAYDQAGMDRTPFLQTITYAVELGSSGEGRILLGSSGNVVEPFLNLIISVADPSGVQQREYTLLMDLPAQSAAAPASTIISGDLAAGSSYTVETGDTLSAIARAALPASGVSVDQMMVAIQRANPDAFANGDMNLLITGRVLRIPTAAEFGAVEPQEAAAQVQQQATALGGEPLSGNGATQAAGGGARDELRLLTNDATPTGGSSDLDSNIAALEAQLMLSEESLDRARIENLELNNRLAALQEQIDLLENIIAIEDERIAQLQAELSAQAQATEQALGGARSDAAAIAALEQQSSGGITGMLRGMVGILGAGVAAVLALIGFLVYRRKQALAAAEEDRFNPALDTRAAAAATIPPDDDAEESDEDAKPGFLSGLLARFRRRDADDDEDAGDDEELAEEEEAPVASAAAAPAAKPESKAAELLDEMGISNDMLNLDEALDDIDENESELEPVEVFEPVDDGHADAPEPDPAQTQDSAPATTAADQALPAVDAAAETAPDVFEFKLSEAEPEPQAVAARAPEAIESFEFKPAAIPVAPPPTTPPSTAALEVVDFAAAKPAPAAPATPPADEADLDLTDLNFDDTTLTGDGAGESEYTPRTGDENDTKLDLATAYEAMGDVVEAIEILDEVIAEGSPQQVETAVRLKKTWQAQL